MSAFVLGASATAPAQAPADGPPELVALRWQGYGESDGCLGVPSLIARVEDHLGRRAFDASSAQIVSVNVDRHGGRFRALVRVLDGEGNVVGERELVADGATCSALDDPLVLAVALLVDDALGRELLPEPVAAPPPPVAPEPEPPEPDSSPPPPAPPREPPPPEPWRMGADVTALGADGVLPSLAFGAELGLRVDAPWLFPVRARAAGFFPQRVELAPAGHVDFALAAVGVAVCPLSLGSSKAIFDACVGADALVQRAESDGLTAASQRSEWFFQGVLSLRLQVDLHGPWYGVLGTSAGLPSQAPHFVYGRAGDTLSVFRMADVTLLTGVGVGVRLSAE